MFLLLILILTICHSLSRLSLSVLVLPNHTLYNTNVYFLFHFVKKIFVRFSAFLTGRQEAATVPAVASRFPAFSLTHKIFPDGSEISIQTKSITAKYSPAVTAAPLQGRDSILSFALRMAFIFSPSIRMKNGSGIQGEKRFSRLSLSKTVNTG